MNHPEKSTLSKKAEPIISTVDRITETLKQNIISGRMARGQRLVVADIANELQVSRGPVREAFNRLEAERLIDLIPHKGAVVKKINREEIIKLFQVREALEGHAARLAAQNINEGNNRARLQDFLAESKALRKNKDIEGFIEYNKRLHQFIASMTGNSELSLLTDRYQLAVFIPILEQAVGVQTLIENALNQHEAIIKAIMTGDMDAAYEAMAAHLWSSANGIISNAS